MKWRDFEWHLEKQKMSKAAFARMVGINPQIVSRWRRRVKGIPRWAAVVIALRSALLRRTVQVRRLARIAYPSGRR